MENTLSDLDCTLYTELESGVQIRIQNITFAIAVAWLPTVPSHRAEEKKASALSL